VQVVEPERYVSQYLLHHTPRRRDRPYRLGLQVQELGDLAGDQVAQIVDRVPKVKSRRLR